MRWAGTRAASASRSSSSTPQMSSASSASHATCLSPRPTIRSDRATCAPASARWRRCPTSGRRRFDVNGPLRAGGAPDPVEEYFIYQNLVGAWPIEPERLEAYMEKALREAKRNANWVEQNHDWEERVKVFCRGLYDHRPFRASFDPFAAKVAEVGERASLAQLLIKLTVPGVADIYQGDEIVSLSLVDPDNRRQIDWQRRRDALASVRAGSAPDNPDTRKLR